MFNRLWHYTFSFIEESDARVDFNQRCTYPAVVGNRWLALRLDIIGSLVVFFASLFSVLGRDTLTGAIVGLSISYALQVTSSLNFLTRNSCDMEMNIVANERLEEYNEVKKEVESNETAEVSLIISTKFKKLIKKNLKF